MTSERVVITRNSTDGATLGQRVYVTGPHFSQDIYSSTNNPALATRFERHVAERLLAAGKWRGNAPGIEEL